ncbi:collagen alpha-3(VI) chain-like [Brachionichthys hirsutus]|uniref:collagen alpha-3(VI) chain-like n=1 Tax=Brachionichthys hirsutus TaxID=412623 RepID=UPI003604CFFA
MRRPRLLPLCALLAVLFAGLLPNLDAQEDCAQGLAADIYFLVDSSWSIGEENFEHVRQFLYDLIQALHRVGGGRFKFALAQYNNKPDTEFQLNSYPTTQGVLAHVKALFYRGGGTRTGLGLDFLSRTHLTAASGSRAAEGAAQLVVVLTDGRSQDDVAAPALVLRLAGVEMFAVGVRDAVESELREMASQPYDTHAFSVDSFLALRDIIQDLVAGLCGAVTRSGGFPVANEAPVTEGGTAQDSADLVVLIDGSQNVGAANFPFVRDLVLRVIEQLDVGRDTVRVALALYNADPEIKFYLNSYDSKSSVLEAVKGLVYPGGDQANLGAALEEVAESLLSQTAGGRAEEGVPQMLVIISAGPSTDDTGASDRALKRAGVITVAVAIGDTATADLEAVATDTSFVLSAPEFSSLANMGDQLLPYINGVVQRTILVQTEFIEVLTAGKRDVIFLIDNTMGSQNIGAVREFIKRFVDTMPIGPDGVQVGVAQFGNVPRLEMDLNTHGTNEAITTALSGIKPRPGATINIGAALNFVRTNMIRPEKGSRLQQGVPQLVMVLTSKKSRDSVEEPARALHQMGVLTLAAGSKAADGATLRQIAFTDTAVYVLKDLRVLSRFSTQGSRTIMNALSTLAGVMVTEVPTEPVVEITTVQTQKVIRDIVFLVDGSNYIGSTNLPYVRDFIINVVNQLDVRPDRVQIGLMQFAESPRIEFYLNSFGNRQDVVNKVSQLRLTGGTTLNTGAAMNYALTNMFKESAGSRQRQRVQQVLVLITGGPTQDEVKTVADRLALAGVLTFTVSSGQADSTQLKTVAFVPNLAYHETRFSDLPALAEVVMPKLITVVGDTNVPVAIPDETVLSGAERDVAFLIDGSDSVRADFPYVRDFILKVIEPLDVGTDSVRISVVQHSERQTPNFYLNTFRTKDEVIRAVNALTLAGGRTLNTGSALRFMKDTIFSERHGSRASQNVPQFLIVLSGSRSRDNVKEPAGILKTEGVVPFGVGVKNADPKQIEAISHNPSFAFRVKEFSELNTIPQKLNNYVSLPKEELALVLQQVQSNAAKRDIVFLLDGSDNTRNGFPEIKLFVKSIVESLSIDGSQDRVSVVQFSDDSKVDFDLNSHKSKNDILNAIDNFRHKGGRRLDIGEALQFVRHSVFTSSMGSRRLEGVPQILILLSTKPSTDNVRTPAFALKEHDIVSVGVGVGDAKRSEMETIAFKPGFTYMVPDLSMLASIQSQVVATLNIDIDTETTMNGISDLSLLNFCLSMYHLVDTGSNKRDIVFLLDGSDDSRNGLPAIREFIRRMAEELVTDEDKVRVAVLQYSDDAAVYFNLNTHKSKKAIIYAIRSLRHKGGRPRNTGAALEFVQDHVFTASSGSRRRDGVPQILILMTGGKSKDDVSEAALKLKEIGVLSFAIGMKNAKQEELQKIAFSSKFLFNLPVFGELLSIQPEIAAFVQADIHPEPPTAVGKKDVVFLLDGSDVTQSDFPAMKSFVHKVVDALDVGEDKDRVSVVQYSREPQTHFSLNTYTEKRDVLDAIEQLDHKGGGQLYTGAALEYVRSNAFVDHYGSRDKEGIPQILILLTGGRSQDDVAGAAVALKQNRVVPFCVGTRNADILEQQMIAHNPFYAFSVLRFEDVGNIHQQLVSFVKRVPRQQPRLKPDNGIVETAKRDIVFLLDGSEGTRNGFPAMRDFVERVVEKLNVGPDNDRISVVQYSRDAEVTFYLNTYTTREDIVDSVRGLKHRGGQPLNTGAALQYVKDNVFTTSSGSRRLQGVAQMLILLNGGRSFDNVETPASALKQQGIVAIPIGTRASDRNELQKISYDPNYALTVSAFTDLPSVQEQLSSVMSTVRVRATPMPPTVTVETAKRDIVFLLDGSEGTRNGFPAMRDFVERVVEKLNVGPDNDRISVVQYSRDAEVTFYLNTYTTREDIVDSCPRTALLCNEHSASEGHTHATNSNW